MIKEVVSNTLGYVTKHEEKSDDEQHTATSLGILAVRPQDTTFRYEYMLGSVASRILDLKIFLIRKFRILLENFDR